MKAGYFNTNPPTYLGPTQHGFLAQEALLDTRSAYPAGSNVAARTE